MNKQPLVSCICITQNRRMYLRRAVQYWQRAARLYPNSELVIVDGSPAPNPMFVEGRDTFEGFDTRYYHIPADAHTRTGWFHNEACNRSRGDVIIHWDDDDWQSAARILSQTSMILGSSDPENTFAFTSRFYWYDIQRKQASPSRTWHQRGEGSLGAMFAYHRKVWEKVPFRDVPQGEDSHFWSDTRQAGMGFLDMWDPTYCIYMRHNQNGSHNTSMGEESVATDVVRSLLGPDKEWYDELAEILPTNPWLQQNRQQYGFLGAWPRR